MKLILKYLRPYSMRMAGGLVIKFVGTVMDLIIPLLLSYILDHVVSQNNFSLVLLYGSLMILCSIIGIVGNVIANRMASYVAKCVTTDLRHDLFAKIEDLSFKQIDQESIPSLISKMTSDTYNVHQMVGMIQRIGIRAPILLVGGIVVTLILDPILTCVLLATLPIIVLLIYFISKKGIPLYTKVQKSIDKMVRVIRENISGARVIKALSKGEYEIQRFEKVNSEINIDELSAGFTMAKLNPLINLTLNLASVGVILVGAFRVDSNLTTPAQIIAFTTYFTIILNAMLAITRIFVVFSRSIASANRILEVLNLDKDLYTIDINEDDKSNDFIIFDKVYFSYNKNEYNIENISFSLKKHESLGIIGATGSGKSTIVNLLMRFYDVDSGRILIDGENLKTYDNQKLKSMFGTVFQNDILFFDSVKENINFGRNLSEKEIEKAAITSQAFEFINNLSQKYDTILSPKGNNISGGQKQRILIARSLAANPDILILDDASSALDYKTDALFRNALKNNYPDVTSIIITQRVSSIITCDKIIVIDDGKIIGYGNHLELLKTCDIYNEIYESQMGGDFDEF